MFRDLQLFGARLGAAISHDTGATLAADSDFDRLARELFTVQFSANPAYRRFCERRGQTPDTVRHWTAMPAMPTAAFKDFEVTSLPPAARTTAFHSSGTSQHRPGRHFHDRASLAVYAASLGAWFRACVWPPRFAGRVLFLSPSPRQTPHSSLVHMFGVLRRDLSLAEARFAGQVAADGAWVLDVAGVLGWLQDAAAGNAPVALLGTAFSFVHLLDALAERHIRLTLPAGSWVMETGGYKNRSRQLPKSELHALLGERLGIPPWRVVCEYGMCELSSQAYDTRPAENDIAAPVCDPARRVFRFPPWARVHIVSPETGREVGEGEPGLVRVVDLANVFSVAAIETEDLGIRRGGGFELIGRAAAAEARGCSLLAA